MRRRSRVRPKRSLDTWQIIYIDLMTNVMIFFVVLWAIHARQEKRASGGGFGNETVKLVNLPGDVLFPPGKSDLTRAGQEVIGRLFGGDSHAVLDFATHAPVKRMLVVHGHTDSDGRKEQNLELGYRRALSAYYEILRYGSELADHVVLCTHADNSAAQEVPKLGDQLSAAEQAAVKAAKAKNRRISIEDRVVSRVKETER